VWHPADLPEELPHALQPVPAARKRFTTVANRMNYRKMSDQALAAAAARGKLDVRPDDRVLIMLPDGPGFADAFAGTIQQGAVPLPVNPLLPARHCGSHGRGRCPTGMGSADQIHVEADLDAEPPILVEGPRDPGQPRCDCA